MRRISIKLLAAAGVLALTSVQAQQASVVVSIKDKKFQPAVIHAAAGAPMSFRLVNLDTTAVKVASATLRFDRLLSPNTGAIIDVQALPSGRYMFFDVAYQQAQGMLVLQ